MDITEPNGRLMQWRVKLGELHFQVVKKNGIINTDADALSRLNSLGETTVSVDA